LRNREKNVGEFPKNNLKKLNFSYLNKKTKNNFHVKQFPIGKGLRLINN